MWSVPADTETSDCVGDGPPEDDSEDGLGEADVGFDGVLVAVTPVVVSAPVLLRVDDGLQAPKAMAKSRTATITADFSIASSPSSVPQRSQRSAAGTRVVSVPPRVLSVALSPSRRGLIQREPNSLTQLAVVRCNLGQPDSDCPRRPAW